MLLSLRSWMNDSIDSGLPVKHWLLAGVGSLSLRKQRVCRRQPFEPDLLN
jgi:hypothetical protein